jgi:DNA-binding transcriptional ArsR family regulator
MNAYPNISRVAALIGDPTRAAILNSLLDGRALPASELAYIAKVSPQTVSSHLSKLADGNLVEAETHGRHRYYRLASQQVAQVLESLSTLAPAVEVRTLRQSEQLKKVRYARTCYDHLAGQLGVELTQVLAERGLIELDGKEFIVTEPGAAWLEGFGLDLAQLRKGRRQFCRACLDWSERRPHLAGAVGAALTDRLFARSWIERVPDSRAVRITEEGRAQFEGQFGLLV